MSFQKFMKESRRESKGRLFDLVFCPLFFLFVKFPKLAIRSKREFILKKKTQVRKERMLQKNVNWLIQSRFDQRWTIFLLWTIRFMFFFSKYFARFSSFDLFFPHWPQFFIFLILDNLLNISSGPDLNYKFWPIKFPIWFNKFDSKIQNCQSFQFFGIKLFCSTWPLNPRKNHLRFLS